MKIGTVRRARAYRIVASCVAHARPRHGFAPHNYRQKTSRALSINSAPLEEREIKFGRLMQDLAVMELKRIKSMDQVKSTFQTSPQVTQIHIYFGVSDKLYSLFIQK